MDDRPSDPKAPHPTVLLVGTPHLANRNRDLFNVQFDDMLAPRRQRELADVSVRLQRFAPTKIAVEVATERAAALTAEYGRYRAGDFDLPADEVYQLGFRTAAACGHERVFAINWNDAVGYTHTMDEVLAFAQAHQPALVDAWIGVGTQRHAAAQAAMTYTSVLNLLRSANDLVQLAQDHQGYLTMAQIGVGTEYVGIGWVQGWFARNLRIFVNLTRIVTAPTDRVLVLYGAGHIPLLTQFLHDSGRFKLEAVERYLGAATPAPESR